MPRSHHFRAEDRPLDERSLRHGMSQATTASQQFQAVMGFGDAKSFPGPPCVPSDLVQAFNDGLQEFGSEMPIQGNQENNQSAAGGTFVGSPGGNASATQGIVNQGSAYHGVTDPLLSSILPRPQGLADRKHDRASESEDSSAQQSKRARNESAFSKLASSSKAAPQTSFPKTFPALAHRLTQWLDTMGELYRQCPNDQLMQIHLVFPYPPVPPLNRQLASISFRDTSTGSSQELLSFGLDDAESILYAEVDTFRGRRDVAADTAREASDCTGVGSRKHARMSLRGDAAYDQPPRNRDMRELNSRGEGRWCFVLVQGSRKPGGAVPQVCVAWPASAAASVENNGMLFVSFAQAGGIPLLDTLEIDEVVWGQWLTSVGAGNSRILMVPK